MAASNSKGVVVSIVKQSAIGTTAEATAASLANPSVISTVDSVAVGDIAVFPSDTGLLELNNKYFIADTIVAGTSFAALGANTTNSVGTFVESDVTIYAESDMQILCLSVLTFNPETPASISTGTYCDPATSIASAAVAAGTVDIGGYVDIASSDYQELLAWSTLNQERFMKIYMPDNGWILMKLTLDSFNWEIPLDGAISYSGSATLASLPRHLFVAT